MTPGHAEAPAWPETSPTGGGFKVVATCRRRVAREQSSRIWRGTQTSFTLVLGGGLCPPWRSWPEPCYARGMARFLGLSVLAFFLCTSDLLAQGRGGRTRNSAPRASASGRPTTAGRAGLLGRNRRPAGLGNASARSQSQRSQGQPGRGPGGEANRRIEWARGQLLQERAISSREGVYRSPRGHAVGANLAEGRDLPFRQRRLGEVVDDVMAAAPEAFRTANRGRRTATVKISGEPYGIYRDALTPYFRVTKNNGVVTQIEPAVGRMTQRGVSPGVRGDSGRIVFNVHGLKGYTVTETIFHEVLDGTIRFSGRMESVINEALAIAEAGTSPQSVLFRQREPVAGGGQHEIYVVRLSEAKGRLRNGEATPFLVMERHPQWGFLQLRPLSQAEAETKARELSGESAR